MKPLLLMPGLYGSQLYGTTNSFSKHWYCPKNLEDDVVWVDGKYAVPPMFNCMFEMLEAYYDEKKDIITSQPGLDIHSHDFGGIDGISKIVEILGFKVLESFDHMAKYMKKRGYVVRKNLFGIPYDWRLGPAGLKTTSFYADLKHLIEDVYTINNNRKITFLGYSLGGMILSRFLGVEVDDEWRKQYIEKAIFLAPALGGAGDTLEVSWKLKFPILEFVSSKSVRRTIQNMPCVHVLYPNHVVFKDTVVIKTPTKDYYPKDVPEFLISNNKIQGDTIKMLEKSVEISKQAPADPKVPIMLLYNSGHETLIGLNFEKGLDEDPTEIYTKGDGTVPYEGPFWCCNNWKKDKAILCYDMKSDSNSFTHSGLGNNAYVNELIFNYTNFDNWHLKKGARFIEAPLVIADELQYTVLDEIRPETIREVK